MPSLGADMERGTVLEWRVAPGDTVHRGDIMAVVATEKSDIEVEIFEDGVIESIVVPVGEEVEVGALLATVAAVGAPVVATPSCVEESRPPGPSYARTTEPAEPTPPAVLSPLVRHRAEELGVAVAALHGSGRGGVVTRADVERSAPVTGGRRRSSPLARRLAREAGVDVTDLRGTGPGGAVVAADVTVPVTPAPPPARRPRLPGVGPAEVRSPQPQPHPQAEAAAQQLLQLAPGLDLAWRLAVRRPGLGHCAAFDHRCAHPWEALAPTERADLRACHTCQQRVRGCTRADQARDPAWPGGYAVVEDGAAATEPDPLPEQLRYLEGLVPTDAPPLAITPEAAGRARGASPGSPSPSLSSGASSSSVVSTAGIVADVIAFVAELIRER
jgi:hypothetical protein